MRPSTVTNIPRVIVPCGAKRSLLTPPKKPFTRAYCTALKYQSDVFTSANGLLICVPSAAGCAASALTGSIVSSMQTISRMLRSRFVMVRSLPVLFFSVRSQVTVDAIAKSDQQKLR